jgi:hypothetical protein
LKCAPLVTSPASTSFVLAPLRALHVDPGSSLARVRDQEPMASRRRPSAGNRVPFGDAALTTTALSEMPLPDGSRNPGHMQEGAHIRWPSLGGRVSCRGGWRSVPGDASGRGGRPGSPARERPRSDEHPGTVPRPKRWPAPTQLALEAAGLRQGGPGAGAELLHSRPRDLPAQQHLGRPDDVHQGLPFLGAELLVLLG